MQLRYFGTDGIRGVYGEPPMDEAFLRRIGYALARYFAIRWPVRKLHVAAGRDPRVSGPAILAAIAEGLVVHGHHVLDAGVVPTPAIPDAVVGREADFGLMITASHNPPADNGVKFFDENGLKLETAAEADLEALMDRERPPPAPRPPSLGRVNIIEPYRHRCASLLPERALEGWVVAVDCAHGATCATTPEVFRRLGATVHTLAGEPDGARINDGVGSEHPQGLAELTQKTGARLGIAHDGDGDRCVACDETGAVVDGDQVLGVLALHALRAGKLRHGVVVATVQSNLGLDQAVAAAGGRVVRVPVGDRQVLRKLLELGASLGGENSGHIIFPEIARCGDGLLAALQIANVLRETGRPLSQLRGEAPLLPQVTANLPVRVKAPLDELPIFSRVLRVAENALTGRGRVLARYSGTEKKLRLLVEGPARPELEQILNSLKQAAQKELG